MGSFCWRFKKTESSGVQRNKYTWNVQRMFLFMLINSLRLHSCVAYPAPFSPRHLQSSSDLEYANMGLEWVGAGLGTGLYRWCCRKLLSILAKDGNCSSLSLSLSLSGQPFFLLVVLLKRYWCILVQQNEILSARTYSLRGPCPWPGSLDKLLPNGLLDWIISSNSTIMR